MTHPNVIKWRKDAFDTLEVARGLATSAVEASARDILSRHPHTFEYIHTNLGWFFTVDGEPVGIKRLRGMVESGALDRKSPFFVRAEEHWTLVSDLETAGLDIGSMKFTAKGPLQKDW
jgi:hypothetical protein